MIKRDDILQSDLEIKELLWFIYLTKDLEGEYAEVGTYCGGSAQIIYNYMNKNKLLYLFDTFDGFKDIGEHDKIELQSLFKFEDSYNIIKNLFPYPNVKIIKGYFPESVGDSINKTKFSLVHIDVDTYRSTLNTLEFLYPKMVYNGVMLLHDYINPNLGVRKACDEFFKGKNEGILQLGTSQGYIIKV